MRGLVRLLIMFGPMIFRQVEKFRRNRSKQVEAPQQRQPERKVQQPENKKEKPVEEEYYEEDIPEADEFVDPINN